MKTIGDAHSTVRPKELMEREPKKLGTPIPVEAPDEKGKEEKGEKK